MVRTSPIAIAGVGLITANVVRVVTGRAVDMRGVVGGFGALIFLVGMSMISALQPIANGLAWLFVLVLFLTDGYTLIQAIGGQ